MLYLISLGLWDKLDISLRAIETAKKCNRLYFEGYTNFYNSNIQELVDLFDKKIIYLDREDVENRSKHLVLIAKDQDIGLLVVGDALAATTHASLLIECRENNVDYKIIHGSSILTAVAETGLSLYNFGRIASLPFDHINIDTPIKVLQENGDLHTLILLDLDVKNKKYMKIKEAIKYFLKYKIDRNCIVCCGLGSDRGLIKYGRILDFIDFDVDIFPQCLIIPGKLHFIELEFLAGFN